MDGVFIALAEGVIECIDEKYGRAAAWIAAVVIVILPVALLVGAVWWFTA